jgi:hypothetical protein
MKPTDKGAEFWARLGDDPMSNRGQTAGCISSEIARKSAPDSPPSAPADTATQPAITSVAPSLRNRPADPTCARCQAAPGPSRPRRRARHPAAPVGRARSRSRRERRHRRSARHAVPRGRHTPASGSLRGMRPRAAIFPDEPARRHGARRAARRAARFELAGEACSRAPRRAGREGGGAAARAGAGSRRAADGRVALTEHPRGCGGPATVGEQASFAVAGGALDRVAATRHRPPNGQAGTPTTVPIRPL